MQNDQHDYCFYSGLPSPMAYVEATEISQKKSLSIIDYDRVIEMAWEDRTPFEAIYFQFGLKEKEVRNLMKQHLKFGSYKLWRERVENCKTKHLKLRLEKSFRFKSKLQRHITGNKISKRK